MAKRPKAYADTTVPPISGNFAEIVRAMLNTPPPPAGDPSTRKKKAEKAKNQSGKLVREFKAAHAKGMKALTGRDYAALNSVVNEETQILKTQAALITERQKAAAALSRKITDTLEKAKKTKKKR